MMGSAVSDQLFIWLLGGVESLQSAFIASELNSFSSRLNSSMVSGTKCAIRKRWPASQLYVAERITTLVLVGDCMKAGFATKILIRHSSPSLEFTASEMQQLTERK